MKYSSNLEVIKTVTLYLIESEKNLDALSKKNKPNKPKPTMLFSKEFSQVERRRLVAFSLTL